MQMKMEISGQKDYERIHLNIDLRGILMIKRTTHISRE